MGRPPDYGAFATAMKALLPPPRPAFGTPEYKAMIAKVVAEIVESRRRRES